MNFERNVTRGNIENILLNYKNSIKEIGASIGQKKGLELLTLLKREIINVEPYPTVTLFEAANRIMTDLVILEGIKWIFDNNIFPFEIYTIEYGNENENSHDITANNSTKNLIGEAFNVAPSFFQGKKSSAVDKLKNSTLKSDYKLLLINSDAVTSAYQPKLNEGIFHVFININSGIGKSFPISERQVNLKD
ncbi:hypothetical protein [Leptospira stimsonii]|uniref:Uncharacterized protein n=1 Tax=Leptospira stimsonii TaxID=2202203 RepID=A0A396Z8I2_9LEPT|nr:hypothetical protein [Leptospira stimsonii]RHX89440.1 hypothetical protein DLM75_16595 [Leptospira stimsonii]